eukprot:gene19230-25855_t
MQQLDDGQPEKQIQHPGSACLQEVAGLRAKYNQLFPEVEQQHDTTDLADHVSTQEGGDEHVPVHDSGHEQHLGLHQQQLGEAVPSIAEEGGEEHMRVYDNGNEQHIGLHLDQQQLQQAAHESAQEEGAEHMCVYDNGNEQHFDLHLHQQQLEQTAPVIAEEGSEEHVHIHLHFDDSPSQPSGGEAARAYLASPRPTSHMCAGEQHYPASDFAAVGQLSPTSHLPAAGQPSPASHLAADEQALHVPPWALDHDTRGSTSPDFPGGLSGQETAIPAQTYTLQEYPSLAKWSAMDQSSLRTLLPDAAASSLGSETMDHSSPRPPLPAVMASSHGSETKHGAASAVPSGDAVRQTEHKSETETEAEMAQVGSEAELKSWGYTSYAESEGKHLSSGGRSLLSDDHIAGFSSDGREMGIHLHFEDSPEQLPGSFPHQAEQAAYTSPQQRRAMGKPISSGGMSHISDTSGTAHATQPVSFGELPHEDYFAVGKGGVAFYVSEDKLITASLPPPYQHRSPVCVPGNAQGPFDIAGEGMCPRGPYSKTGTGMSPQGAYTMAGEGLGPPGANNISGEGMGTPGAYTMAGEGLGPPGAYNVAGEGMGTHSAYNMAREGSSPLEAPGNDVTVAHNLAVSSHQAAPALQTDVARYWVSRGGIAFEPVEPAMQGEQPTAPRHMHVEQHTASHHMQDEPRSASRHMHSEQHSLAVQVLVHGNVDGDVGEEPLHVHLHFEDSSDQLPGSFPHQAEPAAYTSPQQFEHYPEQLPGSFPHQDEPAAYTSPQQFEHYPEQLPGSFLHQAEPAAYTSPQQFEHYLEQLPGSIPRLLHGGHAPGATSQHSTPTGHSAGHSARSMPASPANSPLGGQVNPSLSPTTASQSAGPPPASPAHSPWEGQASPSLSPTPAEQFASSPPASPTCSPRSSWPYSARQAASPTHAPPALSPTPCSPSHPPPGSAYSFQASPTTHPLTYLQTEGAHSFQASPTRSSPSYQPPGSAHSFQASLTTHPITYQSQGGAHSFQALPTTYSPPYQPPGSAHRFQTSPTTYSPYHQSPESAHSFQASPTTYSPPYQPPGSARRFQSSPTTHSPYHQSPDGAHSFQASPTTNSPYHQPPGSAHSFQASPTTHSPYHQSTESAHSFQASPTNHSSTYQSSGSAHRSQASPTRSSPSYQPPGSAHSFQASPTTHSLTYQPPGVAHSFQASPTMQSPSDQPPGSVQRSQASPSTHWTSIQPPEGAYSFQASPTTQFPSYQPPEGAHSFQASLTTLSTSPYQPPGSKDELVTVAEWDRLNCTLRDQGFSALNLQSARPSGKHQPELAEVYRVLNGVMEQYVKRNRVMHELLSATDEAQHNEHGLQAQIRELTREAAKCRQEAERERRKAFDVSHTQLPRDQARMQAQVEKARADAARLREQVHKQSGRLAAQDKQCSACARASTAYRLLSTEPAKTKTCAACTSASPAYRRLNTEPAETKTCAACASASPAYRRLNTEPAETKTCAACASASPAYRRLNTEPAETKTCAACASASPAYRRLNTEPADLRECITSLQAKVASDESAAVVSYKQRIAELETLLKAKEKNTEKTISVKEHSIAETSEGMAKALERAFAAEDVAGRCRADLQQMLARLGSVENAAQGREKEVARLHDVLAELEEDKRAAATTSAASLARAEEAARKLDVEATGLRLRVLHLENELRDSQKNRAKLREEGEALRQSVYDEVCTLEDEMRNLQAELINQLELAHKSKDRDLQRGKEEKDSIRAAERERARVAEEVAVKLETELSQAKSRLATTDSMLRVRERDLERANEALKATRGAEYEELVKSSKGEESVRKLESELTTSRLRVIALEGNLKARERDLERLNKTIDSLKSEAYDLNAKLAKTEEAGRCSEGELAKMRSRIINAEGGYRVKEREIERLTRVLESSKLAEAEGEVARSRALETARKAEDEAAAAKLAEAEGEVGRSRALETARKAENEAVAAKVRASQAEGSLRSRDLQLERLNRPIESTKKGEVRASQAEGALRSRDLQLERLNRLIDSTKKSEADSSAHQQQQEEASQKLEADLSGTLQRLQQLDGQMKGKEKEMAVLQRTVESLKKEAYEAAAARAQRMVESLKKEAYEAAAARAQAEEAVLRGEGDCAAARQRAAQAEGLARSRAKEVERLNRLMSMTHASEYDMSMKQAQAKEAVQRLEAGLVASKQREKHLEGLLRAKEKEMEKLHKQVDITKDYGHEVAAQKSLTEEAAQKLEADLAASRKSILMLEGQMKAKDKEVERMRLQTEEAVRSAEVDAAVARQRCQQLEGALAAKERDLAKMMKGAETAKKLEAELEVMCSDADEAARRAEGELGGLRQRLVQCEGALKAKDRQLERAEKLMEAARKAEGEHELGQAKSEEVSRKLEGEMAVLRQRILQLEGAVRGKEKEMEKLQRLLDQTKSSEVESALKVLAVQDSEKAVGADLSAARKAAQQLEGLLRNREKEMANLQRTLETTKAEAFESNAVEEMFKGLESDLSNTQHRVSSLEVSLNKRSQEVESLHRLLERERAYEGAHLAEKSRGGESGLKVLAVQVNSEKGVGADSRGTQQLPNSYPTTTQQVESGFKVHVYSEKGVGAASSGTQLQPNRYPAGQTSYCYPPSWMHMQVESGFKVESGLKVHVYSEQGVGAALSAATTATQQLPNRNEEAVRKLEAALGEARRRFTQAESGLKQKSKELSSQLAVTDEFMQEINGDMMKMRTRLKSLEGLLKTKDAELARLSKSLDREKGSQHGTHADLLRTDELACQLSAELSTFKQLAVQFEAALSAKDREMARLAKVVEQTQEKEAETSLRHDEIQAAARELDMQSSVVRQRLVKALSTIKSKERDMDRLAKSMESVRAVEEDLKDSRKKVSLGQCLVKFGKSLGQCLVKGLSTIKSKDRDRESMESIRAAKEDLKDSRKKSKERDIDLLAKSMESIRAVEEDLKDSRKKSKGRDIDPMAKSLESIQTAEEDLKDCRKKAESRVLYLEGELAVLRQRAVHAEGACKSHNRECEKLRRQIEQYKAAEYEATTQVMQTEEAVQKLDSDLVGMRQRLKQVETALRTKDSEIGKLHHQLDASKGSVSDMAAKHDQLEALLRSRDLEVSRLAKSVEHERQVAGELETRLGDAKEEVSRTEGELAAARQRALQAESQSQTHERELLRLTKSHEALRTADAESSTGRLAAEAAAAAAAAETAAARRHAQRLEAQIKAKDKELTTAQREVEAAKEAEYSASSMRAQAEEATAALDASLEVAKKRASLAEGLVRRRDQEVETLQKCVEELKAAEYSALGARMDSEDAARALRDELATLRARLSQQEGRLKAKEREVDRLSKQVDASEAAEAAASLSHARKVKEVLEASTHTATQRAKWAKVVQLDNTLRSKDREISRMERMVESAKSAQAASAANLSKCEETVRKLEGEAALHRSRVIHLESSCKVKEREIERLQRSLESAKSTEFELSSEKLQTDEYTRTLDADLAAVHQSLAQLEAQLRAREKDVATLTRQLDQAKGTEHDVLSVAIMDIKKKVAALTRQLDQAKGTEHDVLSAAIMSEEAARKLGSDVMAQRQRVIQLEGTLAVRLASLERCQRQLADMAGSVPPEKLQEAEEKLRKLEVDSAQTRARAVSLESSVKSKESEVGRLNKLLEQTRKSEYELSAKHMQAEEAVRTMDLEMTAGRQLIAQLEAAAKVRDSEISRLTKLLDQSKSSGHDADADTRRARELIQDLEANLAAANRRIKEQEALLLSKGRELATIEKLVKVAKGSELEAAATGTRKSEDHRVVCCLLQDCVEKQDEVARVNEMEAVASVTRKSEDHSINDIKNNDIKNNKPITTKTINNGNNNDIKNNKPITTKTINNGNNYDIKNNTPITTKTINNINNNDIKNNTPITTKTINNINNNDIKNNTPITTKTINNSNSNDIKNNKPITTNTIIEKLESEVTQLRARLQSQDNALASKEKEMERMTKSAQSQDIALASKEKEMERATKTAQAAHADMHERFTKADAAYKEVSIELAQLRRELAQHEQGLRVREKECERLQRLVEASHEAEAQAADVKSKGGVKAEEAAKKLEASLAESKLKSRDREIETLQRMVDSTRAEAAAVTGGVVSSMFGSPGRGSAKAGNAGAVDDEVLRKVEAELSMARAKVDGSVEIFGMLEAKLSMAGAEVVHLEHGIRNSGVVVRAWYWQRVGVSVEIFGMLEAKLSMAGAEVVHLEHAILKREVAMDKLRLILSDKVAKEERRVARDKDIYLRLRQAHASTRQAGQQAQAGAVSAAARELRPVEIVSIYESQRKSWWRWHLPRGGAGAGRCWPLILSAVRGAAWMLAGIMPPANGAAVR